MKPRARPTLYCGCGHSIRQHIILEDLDRDGTAPALCKAKLSSEGYPLCGCTKFDCDYQLSIDKRDMDYERYIDSEIDRLRGK